MRDRFSGNLGCHRSAAASISPNVLALLPPTTLFSERRPRLGYLFEAFLIFWVSAVSSTFLAFFRVTLVLRSLAHGDPPRCHHRLPMTHDQKGPCAASSDVTGTALMV